MTEGFVNTLEGASAEDIDVLAEHFATQFPERSDALRTAQRLPEHIRAVTIAHVVKGTIASIVRESPQETAEQHPVMPAHVRSDEQKMDYALRKTKEILDRVSPDRWKQMADAAGKDVDAYKKTRWDNIYNEFYREA